VRGAGGDRQYVVQTKGNLGAAIVVLPQAITVPSLLRARQWAPPAAIAVTLFNPMGMFVCP